MKAKAVRNCAQTYSLEQIQAAIEAFTEREEEILEIEGDDAEERLTHLFLAQRIHERMADGEAFKAAFRAEMAGVRDILS